MTLDSLRKALVTIDDFLSGLDKDSSLVIDLTKSTEQAFNTPNYTLTV